ncbi:MAG TPA: TetR/AcrR family transcriptional regulator [Terriglobales bacterium]|nr:TetR/AcrR family transcriptional regulator [Terriglobales bacterium]
MRSPNTIAKRTRRGSRGQPERTRAAILDAAVREFAQEGIAGARIDAIARRARVNKALLYYYFRDKERLYGAALDHVFSGLRQRIFAVLDRGLGPRQTILAWAGAHFDYVAGAGINPGLLSREMMRAGRHGSPHLRRLARNYFRPVSQRLIAVMQQGMDSGEFRRVDPQHFLFSVISMIVFYFSSAPLMRLLRGEDPLAPAQVATRRAAVLDLIAAALFREANGRPRRASAGRPA